MTEEWRDVVGYEGIYQVSSLGRVRSSARSYMTLRFGKQTKIRLRGRMLSTPLTAGYPSVRLGSKTQYVHILVCEAWHGPRPSGCLVAHYDDDKMNNVPSNLRWATPRENMSDKARLGTQKRGNDLWFTKISDEDVARIRAKKGRTDKQWAEELSVSESLVNLIRNRKRRVHDTLELAA